MSQIERNLIRLFLLAIFEINYTWYYSINSNERKGIDIYSILYQIRQINKIYRKIKKECQLFHFS